MRQPLKIDFISDISCPWCIIGLKGLEQALARLGEIVSPHITFRPFELNPDMRREGQNIVEHIAGKYGSTPEQSAADRQMIRDRAAEFGFTIAILDDSRIYNTFDAHRLLHWAADQGRQSALKHALFEAYFTRGEDVSDHEALTACAERAGLDPVAAREVLSTDRFAAEVRSDEQLWRARGISAVPVIVINDRYLITGSHSPDVFEQALRSILKEAA